MKSEVRATATPIELLEAIGHGLLRRGYAVELDGNALMLDFGAGPIIVADAMNGRVRVRAALDYNARILPGCTEVRVTPGSRYARVTRLIDEAALRIESRKVALDNCPHTGDNPCKECGKERS